MSAILLLEIHMPRGFHSILDENKTKSPGKVMGWEWATRLWESNHAILRAFTAPLRSGQLCKKDVSLGLPSLCRDFNLEMDRRGHAASTTQRLYGSRTAVCEVSWLTCCWNLLKPTASMKKPPVVPHECWKRGIFKDTRRCLRETVTWQASASK